MEQSRLYDATFTLYLTQPLEHVWSSHTDLVYMSTGTETVWVLYPPTVTSQNNVQTTLFDEPEGDLDTLGFEFETVNKPSHVYSPHAPKTDCLDLHEVSCSYRTSSYQGRPA